MVAVQRICYKKFKHAKAQATFNFNAMERQTNRFRLPARESQLTDCF